MSVELIAVEGIGEVRAGTRLGELIADRYRLRGGDVICISQKIVSKAEGRIRDLDQVAPSAEARDLASRLGKDAGAGRAGAGREHADRQGRARAC